MELSPTRWYRTMDKLGMLQRPLGRRSRMNRMLDPDRDSSPGEILLGLVWRLVVLAVATHAALTWQSPWWRGCASIVAVTFLWAVVRDVRLLLRRETKRIR